ncbi:MAG: pectate lyase, partial [Alistipes sp.]|nr:pectate lyase [Alistipes sp.]
DVTPEGDASPWCALSDGGVKKSRLRDTDGDGMPDWWEREKGLDPRNEKDGRAVAATSDYYTNLECYLNSLVP